MNVTLSATNAPAMAARARLVEPVWHFGVALLRATLQNPRALATALGTPLFILLIFWLTSLGQRAGEFDLLAFMFPAIVGFSVMLGGQPLAIRLVTWREQGVFQRLACTPAPLGALMVGAAGAQVVLALVQALAVLGFGVLVIRIPVDAGGTLVALAALTLGAACFIAYSLLVAAVARRAETASLIFVFTLMPMFFLGGGLPPQLLPPALRAIGQWLPTSMVSELTTSLLTYGTLPANPALPLLGLLAYTLVFTLAAARLFRWE